MKSKYSPEEKFQIVMESFTDNVTQAEICRRHGIYPVQLSKWREQFILGGKSALTQRRNSDSRDEETQDLKKIIGDQFNTVRSIMEKSREIIFCDNCTSGNSIKDWVNTPIDADKINERN